LSGSKLSFVNLRYAFFCLLVDARIDADQPAMEGSSSLLDAVLAPMHADSPAMHRSAIIQ